MEPKWMVQLSCGCLVALPDPKPAWESPTLAGREAMVCAKHRSDPARNLAYPIVFGPASRYRRDAMERRDAEHRSWVASDPDGRLLRGLSNDGRVLACQKCWQRPATDHDLGDMHGYRPACNRCYYGEQLAQTWKRLRELPHHLWQYLIARRVDD